MCHQNNLRFYDDIAYDRQYKGLILDGYEGKVNRPGGHLAAVLPVHTEQLECALHLQISSPGAADHVKDVAMSWIPCFSIPRQALFCQLELPIFGTATAANRQREADTISNCDATGDRLAKVMDGKRTLLHANHGIIVCTETVAEAFDYLYYLEKAGEITVKAMSTGRPLQLIPDNVCKMFHTDMEPPHLVKVHWYPHGHAAHFGTSKCASTSLPINSCMHCTKF